MTKKWICTTIFAFALMSLAGVVLAQQPQQPQQPQPQAINPWGAQPYQSGTGQPYQAHSFNGQSASVLATPTAPTPIAGSTASDTPVANPQAGMAAQQMPMTGTTTSAGMIPSGTVSKTQPVYKPMPVFNPYQQTTRQISGGGAAVYGQFTPSGTVDRPFEHYQAPSPISPYMQLYRTDNVSGIDNYNMYVKPAIEAEQQRIEMQNQLDALQQQQTQMQQTQQFQQPQTGTQSVSGAVYGNINSGLGASYSTTTPNAPTVEPSPTAEEEEQDETKQTDQQTDQNTTPNYNALNPYIPAGTKPSQYMVQP